MAALDPNAVVTVTVSTILSPAPNDYQQTGALLSFGGTNLPANSQSQLSTFEDLAAIIMTEDGIVNAVWNVGDPVGPPIIPPMVTITFQNPLPAEYPVGVIVDMSFFGFTPSTLNGVFLCTITGPDSATYDQPIDPGVMLVAGNWATTASIELNAMAATFFRQGAGQSVWVLELGLATDVAGQVE